MGAKRIPIKAAKALADKYGQSQVIIVTFDNSTGLTHVVTYGKTKEECAHAAEGGNLVKKALGWPSELCEAKPARVKAEATCLTSGGWCAEHHCYVRTCEVVKNGNQT